MLLQRMEHHVHEHGAAFDINRSRTIDAVARFAPVKVVALLFVGREHRIQVRNKPNCLPGTAVSGQHQVLAVVGDGRLDKFCLKA